MQVTSTDLREPLDVRWDGPVAIITLNRPKALNATNADLHAAVTDVWGEVATDERLRAAVVTGAGKAFSAGGDLPLLQNMADDPTLRAEVLAEGQRLAKAVAAFPVPIVAAVNGPAVGLGCSLASLCDLVVMEEHAYFMDPHVSLGLAAADGAVFTWPAQMSLPRVKEFIYLGRRITAEEAERFGLVNAVVPTGTSVEKALEYAAQARRFAAAGVARDEGDPESPLTKRLDDGFDGRLRC